MRRRWSHGVRPQKACLEGSNKSIGYTDKLGSESLSDTIRSDDESFVMNTDHWLQSQGAERAGSPSMHSLNPTERLETGKSRGGKRKKWIMNLLHHKARLDWSWRREQADSCGFLVRSMCDTSGRNGEMLRDDDIYYTPCRKEHR